jgi:hypothetical protein
MMSIFNGGDYYIEIFSRRYMHEMEKLKVADKKENDERNGSQKTE